MNEFVGKKLGEVLAFSNLGIELFDRGAEVLEGQFEDFGALKETFLAQAESVKDIAQVGGVYEVTEKKAVATEQKLRGMMETYIGDEWSNLAELLEWMGFFEGAAVVHWRLVEGAAETLDDNELHQLAADGADLHHDLLHRAQAHIKSIGAKRANE